MRLSILALEHMKPLQKIKLRLLRRVAGIIPPPIMTLSYRRELFGKPFGKQLQQSLRDESDWKAGELELFAAFVSKLNACDF